MTTHSSMLAWEIPRTKGPGGLQSMGSGESDRIEQQQWYYVNVNFTTNI